MKQAYKAAMWYLSDLAISVLVAVAIIFAVSFFTGAEQTGTEPGPQPAETLPLAPPFEPPADDFAGDFAVGAPEQTETITLVRSDSFPDARELGLPVLVFYTADWCGVCKPYLDELLASDVFVATAGERCTLCVIDVDGLSKSTRPRSIPELRLFRDGERPARLLNAQTPEAVATWLEEQL